MMLCLLNNLDWQISYISLDWPACFAPYEHVYFKALQRRFFFAPSLDLRAHVLHIKEEGASSLKKKRMRKYTRCQAYQRRLLLGSLATFLPFSFKTVAAEYLSTTTRHTPIDVKSAENYSK